MRAPEHFRTVQAEVQLGAAAARHVRIHLRADDEGLPQQSALRLQELAEGVMLQAQGGLIEPVVLAAALLHHFLRQDDQEDDRGVVLRQERARLVMQLLHAVLHLRGGGVEHTLGFHVRLPLLARSMATDIANHRHVVLRPVDIEFLYPKTCPKPPKICPKYLKVIYEKRYLEQYYYPKVLGKTSVKFRVSKIKQPRRLHCSLSPRPLSS